MMNAGQYLDRRGNLFWWCLEILFILLLAFVDYLTGYELSFSLFYLAPISLAAWFKGRRLGLWLSAISAIIWFLADYLSGNRYYNPSLYVWNTLIRLSFFIIVTILLSALRKAYDTNQSLARVDFVSGAVSVGYFYSLAKNEMRRSARYKQPFTLVYIDLDNFKEINDLLGHSTGDRVLRAVTESVKCGIRETDAFGRLGGDEFALLLPETDEREARTAITRLHSDLSTVMRKNGWKVTFSIGAVTYKKPPVSVDEMVKLADSTMYSIKSSTKNGTAYCVYEN
jgi:diguanylate cyclase (GGDEF)-like protein